MNMLLCIRLPKSKYAQTQVLRHLINTPDKPINTILAENKEWGQGNVDPSHSGDSEGCFKG